jgi:hypothetical protein
MIRCTDCMIRSTVYDPLVRTMIRTAGGNRCTDCMIRCTVYDPLYGLGEIRQNDLLSTYDRPPGQVNGYFIGWCVSDYDLYDSNVVWVALRSHRP